MAWKDELNNAKKIFKNGTLKEKTGYIFDYYKWHIIFIIFIIHFIGSMIYNNATAKDYVLQGLFLNPLASVETAAELEEDFIEKHPIDTSSEDVFFDSSLYFSTDNADAANSYQALQILSTRVAAGEIDFIVADDITLTDLSYNGYFSDLTEVLSDEQIKKYEPYFLYYDRVILEELNSIDYTTEELPETVLPDSSKPELMDEPVPVMINITASEKISVLYPNSKNKYAIAFVANSSHTEKSLELLNYLTQ